MDEENKTVDASPADNVTPPENAAALSTDDVFPEVQEHAIAAQLNKAAAAPSEPVKLKKDGTPAKKRGRKANSQVNDPRANSDIQQAQNAPGSVSAKVDSKQAATIVSGILENMQIVLISDEFKYESAERIANVEAWEKTFDHYGGVSISPPQALLLSHASIILARATKPKMQTKLQLLKAGITLKLQNLKERFKNREQLDAVEIVENDAHADNR